MSSLRFLPLINKKLDAWRNAWSKHRIRTIKTSPIRSWVSGQLNCPVDVDIGEEQLTMYGVEGFLSEGPDDNRPAYEAPIDEV